MPPRISRRVCVRLLSLLCGRPWSPCPALAKGLAAEASVVLVLLVVLALLVLRLVAALVLVLVLRCLGKLSLLATHATHLRNTEHQRDIA